MVQLMQKLAIQNNISLSDPVSSPQPTVTGAPSPSSPFSKKVNISLSQPAAISTDAAKADAKRSRVEGLKTPAKAEAKRSRAEWTAELVESLIELRYMSESKFNACKTNKQKTAWWAWLTCRLNTRVNAQFDMKQVKNRFTALKAE